MEFTITLSEKEIDQGSENLYKELTDKYGCRTKDAKLTCLTAEELFLSVRDHFGNDHSVDAVLKKRFGRTFLQICFVSEPFDPRQNNDETSDLLSMYGLIPNYIYKSGKNIITIPVETKKKSQFFGLLAAVIISTVLIMLTEFFPSLPLRTILAATATPLFNTIIGFVSAISGPIIFLSVLSGILAIGDISTLKSVGLRIIKDTLLITALVIILSIIVTSQFYPLSSGSSGNISSDCTAVIQMILDIIPSNFFEPFVTGNSLQIIFLSVVTGAALLTLSSKIKVLYDFVFELQNVVQQIMIWVNSVMPFLVCVTILHIYLSGAVDSIMKAAGTFAADIIVMVITILFSTIFTAIRYKTSCLGLFKKLFPTMVIAATTNSSSAAYLTNTETCRSKLGIDSSLVNFGVPFTQVICMPGIASTLACVTVCLTSYYNISVTPVWYVVAVIGITLIAVAVPPIPGGGLAAYSVLFGLLGIPIEGLAAAIPIEMAMEYAATAVDLSVVQLMLVNIANKVKKLDISLLRSKN